MLAKRIAALAAVVLLLLPCAAARMQGDSWIWITSNDRYGYFFHKDIQRDYRRNVVKVWVKLMYTPAGAAQEAELLRRDVLRDAAYSISLLEFSFANRTAAVLQITFFDGQGRKVYTYGPWEPKHDPVMPDSWLEMVYNAVRGYLIH